MSDARTARIFVLLVVLMAWPAAASAWGDRGHRIIAALAYQYLRPDVRTKVDALLAEDARDNLTRPDFVSRSVWADRVTKLDAKTLAKRGLISGRLWHYAEVQIGVESPLDDHGIDQLIAVSCYGFAKLREGVVASAGPARDCVINKVRQFAFELAEPSTLRHQQILALKYLIHLVGDLHQPVRVVDRGDAWGSGVIVRYLGHEMTLQDYWDDRVVDLVVGTADTPDSTVATRLASSITDHQRVNWQRGSPESWTRDAARAAGDVVYNFAGLDQVAKGRGNKTYLINSTYDERAYEEARKLLSRAGVRLAYLLNEALAGGGGTTIARFAARNAAPDKDKVAPRKGPAFRMVIDDLPDANIQLANGIVVRPSDWPTLIIANIQARLGKGVCTGVLVGPNVALTAAHCVDDPLDPAPASASLEVDGVRIPLRCEIHPMYLARDLPADRTPRGSEDYALCLLDYEDAPPEPWSRIRFDVIDARTALTPREPVLMTGYGCSDLTVSVGGRLNWTEKAGRLRIGDEQIETPPSGGEPHSSYAAIRSELGREPALCPGDSGGPLYTGATTTDASASRRVRAVNSMVESMRRPDGRFDIVSQAAVLGTSAFRGWAEDWLSRHGAKKPVVCGLNRNAGVYPCAR